MSRKIPDWGFNSSLSITSSPVADRGFMPAPILTGCILHQWIASIERLQIWLLYGCSLDLWRFISHRLFCSGLPRGNWQADSYYDCFPTGCYPALTALIFAMLIIPDTDANKITSLMLHCWHPNLSSGSSWFLNDVFGWKPEHESQN